MADQRPDTRAVHGGHEPRPGPLTVPVVQSSTFVLGSSAEMHRYLEGDHDLYLYTRYANPTLRALEESLAGLEGGEDAVVFSSGMAAITTAILSHVAAGDEVLASASLYGGTTRFIRDLMPSWGFASRVIAAADAERLADVAGPRTRVVVVESPTNPTLDVVDLRAVARGARERGITMIVDNTFATPLLQRPLALGADLVMHSLTKALGGHSDIIGGAIVGSREGVDRVRTLMKVMGGCLDPHSAFLVIRGIKTLHLRVERQCANALALARHLERHPKVRKVSYPGLESHPRHALARSQMSGFGGVLSIVVDAGLPGAERFYDALRLMARAASLGGVETLVSLPLQTSHTGYTDEQLRAAGVDKGSVRIAAGIEHPDDLVEDADRALAAV